MSAEPDDFDPIKEREPTRPNERLRFTFTFANVHSCRWWLAAVFINIHDVYAVDGVVISHRENHGIPLIYDVENFRLKNWQYASVWWY